MSDVKDLNINGVKYDIKDKVARQGLTDVGTNIEGLDERVKVLEADSKHSGHSLFDVVAKDHILSYEETKGFAQLGTYVYKNSVAGSRYGYPNFYEKCLEEYRDRNNLIVSRRNNVVLVGSPTITNGVLSDFSTTNYANPSTSTSFSQAASAASTWEEVFKFNASSLGDISITGGNSSTYVHDIALNASGNFCLNLSSNGSSYDIFSGTGTHVVSIATDYWVKLEFNGNEYKLSYSTDGETFTNDITVVSLTKIEGTSDLNYIGARGNLGQPFSGTIDLKGCYININGNRWWTGANTVLKNSNGHAYYHIKDKAIIDSMFESRGEAWYFGVDTANERIFLPRSTRIKFTDAATEVGLYQEAGLPNITSSTVMTGALLHESSGAIYGTGSSKNRDDVLDIWGTNVINFDASLSNPIYGRSDTVEYSSTKLIPYMVVGNTLLERAATEVVDVTTTENDTLPLFTGMYFNYTPNNVSWVLAGGQVTSGTIYAFAYNELVNVLNGETKYGSLKVIDVNDMIEGTDYSQYWKVNQEDETFICPIDAGIFSLLQETKRVLVSKKEPTGADPTWYNLYSDGWCEQGGNVTVTSNIWTTVSLPKPYVDTNYCLTGGSKLLDSSYPDNAQSVSFKNYTQSTFQTAVHDDATINKGTWTWRACGYAAVPSPTEYTEDVKLYFKVANAVQNLELLDAGEVLEAVNDVIPDNSSLIAGYAMPSSRRIQLVTGASGATYTAPADGYLFAECDTSQYGWIIVTNDSLKSYETSTTGATGGVCEWVPIRKGSTGYVHYYNASNVKVWFIYAVGSESEAN